MFSQFHLPCPVDLLIDLGATIWLLSIGQINLSRNNCELFLQKTQLGWVIAGGVNNIERNNSVSCNLSDITDQIAKFWVLEDANDKFNKSLEEILCEAYYVKNTKRDSDGRYIVRLPFRNPDVHFRDSRAQALRRFKSLQRKFAANFSFYAQYSQVMQEYIDLGHMSLSTEESLDGCFLPHHAVIKPFSNTTKMRLVFDASAKSSGGYSLNDTLMIGPTIQYKLVEHLKRLKISRSQIRTHSRH